MKLSTPTLYEIISAERQYDTNNSAANNRIRFELKPHSNLVLTLSDDYVVCSEDTAAGGLFYKDRYPIQAVLHIYSLEETKNEEVGSNVGSCGLYEGNELEHKIYFKLEDYKQLLIDLSNENYPSNITFWFNEALLLRKSGYCEFASIDGKQAARIPIESISFSVPYTKKK